MPAFRSDADFGGVARVTSLLDPSAAQDAATKAYVDSSVTGLNWKDSVRTASTANINLASPGASIDGITMATNDRFLAKDQSTASQNGIYIWNGAAAAATRAPDMDAAAEVEQAITTVEEGTANAGTSWRQTAVNVTLGTTSLAFVAFGTAAPASSETVSGVLELATQAETDTGTDDLRAVTPLKLNTWSSRARTKTGNIGDASSTQIDVTHNWGTRAVRVEVFRNASPWDTIICDVSRPDTNTVRFNFATAPTSNQFTYVLATGGTA